MQMSPLKAGLIAMPIIGIGAFLYVVFSAMDSGQSGAFSSYAKGEMSSFRTLNDTPAQPNIAYVGVDESEVFLADYRGQIILVNFWATWCAPCVEEMPALNNLQHELGGDDFQVVTISLDRSFDLITEFYARMELDALPMIQDATMSSPSQIRALGLPVTILYDRGSVEIGRVPTPAEWDSEDAKRLIRAAVRDY
jgi:thiol-disulfide isomerase/thioredoxin